MDYELNCEKYYAKKIKDFLKYKDPKLSIKIYKSRRDFIESDDQYLTQLFWLHHHGGAYYLNSTIHISKFKKLDSKNDTYEFPYRNDEFISILAHEYGHHLSRVKRYWNKDLRMALNNFSYSPLIMEEEKRAWDFGKEFLQQIECKIPKCFSYIRRKSLKSHEVYHEI